MKRGSGVLYFAYLDYWTSLYSNFWSFLRYQAGLWDVEGKGLSKIEDLSIAQAILRKTQAMNFSIAQKAIGITLALGLLPEIIYRLK